jgi:hypothetical protein
MIDGTSAGIPVTRTAIIPVTVEQRRESMRFVVIVEKIFVSSRKPLSYRNLSTLKMSSMHVVF